MKKSIIVVIVVLIIIYLGVMMQKTSAPSLPTIHPVSHASFVMEWNGLTIYNDPVGDAELYEAFSAPDLILVSDIHGDHLNNDTLELVGNDDTLIIVPFAVAEELSDVNKSRLMLVNNGESVEKLGFKITAVPMYNLPESADSRHTKGRGNGYIVERDGVRVYIAGDTADIPEMRALEDIAIAFVPMNLPYTMTVEAAADAVVEFGPLQVYPYHYRGQDGLSDVELFKTLVNEGNPDVEVVLKDWYPEQE